MRWLPGNDDPSEMHDATQLTHTLRKGVDNKGGNALCCLIGRFCLVLGDPSPAKGLSFSSVSEMEEVTSSSFIKTAKTERAAVNGSGGLSLWGRET